MIALTEPTVNDLAALKPGDRIYVPMDIHHLRGDQAVVKLDATQFLVVDVGRVFIIASQQQVNK